MRKLLLATALTGFMSASVALAIPSSGIISAVQNSSSYSDGGQFTATVEGYSFQTFCIEIFNEFSPGTSYSYTLTQTTHNNPPGASPLKLGTAWLFQQFSTGAFGGTDVGGQFFLNQAQAGELQAALWYFQSQGANPNGLFGAPTQTWNNGIPTVDSPAGQGDKYTDMALAALGLSAYGASNGAYDVQVVSVAGGQDWLAIPDGGTTVILLGIGLVGLVLVSRRLAIAR